MANPEFFKTNAIELEPRADLFEFMRQTKTFGGVDRLLNHFADKVTLKDEFAKYEGVGMERFRYLNYIVPTLSDPVLKITQGEKTTHVKSFTHPNPSGKESLKEHMVVTMDKEGKIELITAFNVDRENYIKNIIKKADKVEVKDRKLLEVSLPYGQKPSSPYDTITPSESNVKSVADEPAAEPLSLEGIPRLEYTIKRAGEYLKGISPAAGVEKLGHFLRAADKHGTRPLKVANPEDSLVKNLARVHIPNFSKRFARNFIYGGGLSDREVDLYSKYRLERSARDFEGLIKEAKALNKEDGEALHLALGGEKPLGELSPRLFPL